jgi:hypothetical protein
MSDLTDSLERKALSPDEKPEVLERSKVDDVVDVKLKLKASNAPERTLVARSVCRDGALALATCTFGSARAANLGASCETAVKSLTIAAAVPAQGVQK